MIGSERRNNILSLITQNGSVAVSDLSKSFGVSEETIRRDLLQLEEDNLLKRTHGGAYIDKVVKERISFKLRRELKGKEKSTIAAIALKQIADGDTIFLDSSSTCLYIAEALVIAKRRITVITNSLAIAEALSNSFSIKVLMLGGALDFNLLCFSGWSTLEDCNRYNADKAFVSCSGLSLESGLSDSDEMEAMIRCSMINRSKRIYLVADLYKFNKVMLYHIAPLDVIDYCIAESPVDGEWIEQFNKLGIEYIFGEEEC